MVIVCILNDMRHEVKTFVHNVCVYEFVFLCWYVVDKYESK